MSLSMERNIKSRHLYYVWVGGTAYVHCLFPQRMALVVSMLSCKLLVAEVAAAVSRSYLRYLSFPSSIFTTS